MIVPVHPNPAVRSQVQAELGQHAQILLCEPLSYIPFIRLMRRADVLVTDSGGVQEEGPTLRKPIIVVRESTERPEGVEAGFAHLVGTDTRRIFDAVQASLTQGLVTDKDNPYGDGKAAQRIMAALTFGRVTSAPQLSSVALAGGVSPAASAAALQFNPEMVVVDIGALSQIEYSAESRLNI
jgi:UDP-N-acetylglucosamine 2-epimerase